MNLIQATALAVGVALFWSFGSRAAPDEEAEVRRMRESIESTARQAARIAGAPLIQAVTLDALERVPRHEFVPEAYRGEAYADRPLPIGHGQTISQPYIVALMTDLAAVNHDSVVLEIGTGSGYQAAVLGLLAKQVYTIEIVEALGTRAAADLRRLGYDNVEVRVGDGYAGWPERAPFDAIVVTAAPESVPPPLIEQLAVGGRLVIPVGPQSAQQLKVLTKQSDGSVATTDIIPVLFVPFTGALKNER